LNWLAIDDNNITPEGFYFSGISAGLKDSRKKDLGLILAPKNSICTGLFTQSTVRAACVDLCEKRISDSGNLIRAILINSGHANACTGDFGLRDSMKATNEVSQLLSVNDDQVLICSTGIIGVPIPMPNLISNLPVLVEKLSNNNSNDLAEAILTTDLIIKRSLIETEIEGRRIRILGIAKGSGMIYPNMATMLSFLVCDVGIEKNIWDSIIKEAAQISFNAISVDGDMSTNDSFIALNGGKKIDPQYLPVIKEGINIVCQRLAKAIARDGEGANCLIEVIVNGARNDLDALKIARKISSSSLVKTAIHGCDPNWGRIISAAGSSGIDFNFSDVDLFIGKYQILNRGHVIQFDKEEISFYIRSKMRGKYLVSDTVEIIINLNSGKGIGKSWGCDLSKKYIEINSEYTT